MNLTNSQQKILIKILAPQLLHQSKYKLSTLSENQYPLDQIEDGC